MTSFFSTCRLLHWRTPAGFALFVCLLASFCGAADWTTVRTVVDGDTIILTDGRHVRYIGIDTPEIDHENHRAAPMGYEARALNRRLVQGQRLKLVTDREAKDHYGRTLAYVYRDDGLFVNAELLKQGCAFCLFMRPNISRSKELLLAQKEAMAEGRGLWQLVDRNEKPAHAYLGNRRSKRFHTEGCPNAKKMSKKNRVWLKNRWAAFWEGYSPARACVDFP